MQGITMITSKDMKRDNFLLNMLYENNLKYLIFENERMQLALKDECTSEIYVSRKKKKKTLESSLTLPTQIGTRKENKQALEAHKAFEVMTETRAPHLTKRYRHMEHTGIREERQMQL